MRNKRTFKKEKRSWFR